MLPEERLVVEGVECDAVGAYVVSRACEFGMCLG